MAKTLLQTATPFSVNAGVTSYVFCLFGFSITHATEANRYRTFRTAGKLSSMFLRVKSNSLTGTTNTTVRTRINGSDGNMIISIPSGATGYFRDSGSTDTIAAGDEVGYKVVAGTAGSSISIGVLSCSFSATSNTTISIATKVVSSFLTASTTRYFAPAGYASTGTVELQSQVQCNTAGTLKNLYVYIDSNARTTATTFDMRINSATGTLGVSVGSGATGIFEDTASTDAVAVNDTLGFMAVTGLGSEVIAPAIISVEFETTNNKFFTSAGNNTGFTRGTHTSYMGICNGQDNTFNYSSDELERSGEIGFGAVISNLWIYISANTNTTASSVILRKELADTAVSVSIAATTTGAFEDTTNSVTYTWSDRAGIKYINTDSASGTMTIHNWSLLVESTDTALEIRVNDTITTTESATTTAHRSISAFDYLFPADSKIEVPGFNYLGGPIVYGSTGTLEAAAQSFVAISTKLSSMQIYLVRSGTPGDDITINITASLGGASLGSATVVAPPTAYTTVTFTDPVALTSGNTYYAEVTRTGSRNTSNFIFGQITSPAYEFPLGDVYYRSSGVWTNYSSSSGDWRSSFTFTGIQTLTMSNLAISVSDSISMIEDMDLGNLSINKSESISISENVSTVQTTDPNTSIQISDSITIEDEPTFDSIRYSADAGHDGINGTMRNIKGNS